VFVFFNNKVAYKLKTAGYTLLKFYKIIYLGRMCHCEGTSIQNVEIWSEKFRRLWSNPVELPAAECSRFVFNSNSVLYAFEDCSVQ